MHSLAQVNQILEASSLSTTGLKNQTKAVKQSTHFQQQLSQQLNHQPSESQAANTPSYGVNNASRKANEAPSSTAATKSNEALTEEEQQEKKYSDQLAAEIREWLAKLSPEEQAEFKEALENDPDAAFALLPDSLQQLVADLKHQEKADLLAQLRLNQDKNAKAYAIKLDNKKDKNAKIQQLIANLNKASQDKESTANRTATANLTSGLAGQAHNLSGSGRENIQQLLQAAGQGLNQTTNSSSSLLASQLGLNPTTTSQLTAGQLASVKAQPVMMQQAAAANANAQALSNRLSIMHAQNMQVAEMRLDPPNLGRVRIQIRMQGKQASVNISAANPQAKQLLEDALPQLKALLGEEGIDLADAQIFDSSTQQEESQSNQTKNFNLANSSTEQDSLISDEEQLHYLTQPLALVDYYA